MLTAVSYDIPDNRRRSNLAKVLLRYGKRVQKSVYELHVNDKEFPALIRQIERIIKEDKDSVRIYRLPVQAERSSIWLGCRVEVKEEPYYIF
jgi:CRISPR-associated protein Cas2